MTFHIVEIFSIELEFDYLLGGDEDSPSDTVTLGLEGGFEEPDPDTSTSDAEDAQSSGSLMGEDSSLHEVVVGWHTEKERLAVWLVGSESFGFAWFDRLVDEGFTVGMPMNFEYDCLFCNDVVDDSDVGDCSKAMMFYDHEVSEKSVSDVDLENKDMFEEDERVWSINTARMRYEDIVSQYVCDTCGSVILESVDAVADEVPEEIVLRSL